jgi:hypothetical protein
LELRINRELLGGSIEKQRERVMQTIADGAKDKSKMEKRLQELEDQIHKAVLILNEYRKRQDTDFCCS